MTKQPTIAARWFDECKTGFEEAQAVKHKAGDNFYRRAAFVTGRMAEYVAVEQASGQA